MPADREYLEKFYEKSADSPKPGVSKEEFIANVEDFCTKRPFTKASVTITNPHDLSPSNEDIKRYNEEKAKPENTTYGWDNLGKELVIGIDEELTKHNHPLKGGAARDEILNHFNGLGKLLGGEMGRPPKQRRISDSELDNIVLQLWQAKKSFFGGLALPGVIAVLRTELNQKDIQEYIDDAGIIKPPGWKDGCIYTPEPDLEGWIYEPPFADFLTYGEDVARGTWRTP